jgi:hypothetical protein
MKWVITILALLAFLLIILVTGGAWEISFNPDRLLAVPMSIWLSLSMMIFIVLLCIVAGKVADPRRDDQS